MFATTLKKIIDNTDGGIGAVVMGLDGISIEAYSRSTDRADVTALGMEFSYILAQVRRATDTLAVGVFEEFTVKAEKLYLLVRLLTPEYFIAVALSSDGNFGKARYLLRLHSPELTKQL